MPATPLNAAAPSTALSPPVGIVVLNWNNARDTLACLTAVRQLDYTNYRVSVVDNASTDGSVELIQTRHPDVGLIRNPRNLGYSEGNNVGLRHALGQGCRYVLILNNDTLVAPRMLSELVAVAERHPEVGLLGPTVFCAEPRDRLFAAGSIIRWGEGLIAHRGMFASTADFPLPSQPHDVDFLIGCGLLVRRDFVQAVGLLDPAFYLNFEDVEWGVRAHRQGYQVWYVPQAHLWHRVSASLGLGSPLNTYYITRNALLFFWKHGPPRLRWLALARIVLRALRSMAAWTLKADYRGELYRRKRSANVFALRDFFLGRFGPMGPDVARACLGERA